MMSNNLQTDESNLLEESLLSHMDTTRVVPTSDVHVSYVDDVAIILNLDSGEYHTLNAVGQFIWKQLTPDTTLSQIRGSLSDTYGVPEATAKEDLLDLVKQLCQANLVQVVQA